MTAGASRAATTITPQPALAPSLQPRPAPTGRALPPELVVQEDQSWTLIVGQCWTPIVGQNWTPIDTGVEPLKEPRDTRALVALLLVGFLAAFTAKLAPMEFVAHQSEPTVAKVA